MITQGPHNITPYVASIDEEKIKQIQEKVITVNRYYDKLNENASLAAWKLIQQTKLCYNRLIEKIAKRKKSNLDLLNDALNNSPVDLEALKNIEKIGRCNEDLLEFQLDDQMLETERIFNIEFETRNNEYLFFNSTSAASNVIDLINLSTLKKTSHTLPVSDQYTYCTACYLGNFTYFLYGGGYSPTVGSVRLMNIKNCTVTPLPSSSQNSFAGACLYKEKIYIFGGFSDGSVLSLSQEFNLVKKTWRALGSLPVPSHQTTGSVISGKIHVTGYGMPNVLIYSPVSNLYSSIFTLTPNCCKYLFENWIVTSGGNLYEFSDGKFIKCQSHSCTITNLTAFIAFRRDHFIYFLSWKLTLLRINTKSKLLESVTYS